MLTLSGLGILSLLGFIVFFVFLLINKEKALNKIVINYIFVGLIACAGYGLMHNFFVNPLFLNSLLRADFSQPSLLAFLITWSYRACIYFVFFSIWLRVLLKRAHHWQNKTKIFKLLIVHAVLIATAWFTDFEKLLYYDGQIDIYHFLHWVGGIIGCSIIYLLEYVFLEKQIIHYLQIDKPFQRIRNKLLTLFLGIPLIMLLAIFSILIGGLGIDSPGTLVAKLAIFALLFLAPLFLVILRITKDIQGNLTLAVNFLGKASQQDFSGSLTVTSRDEFGHLGQSLQLLKENMNVVIRTVTDSATYVDSSALQMSDALSKFITHIDNFFSHLATSSEQRLALSEKAAAKMETMTRQLQEVFDQTHTQARLAEENSRAVQALQQTIQNITEKTNRETTINAALYQIVATGKLRMDEALAGVRKIEDSSQEIKNTIQAINEIAEKAQILAMNAKIEAAHAGQAGKGFGVVATEMSKLSENTQNKANSIISHINGIFQRISHSLKQIDDAFKSFTDIQEQVDSSKNIAFEVADDMNRENTYLANISESIAQLAAASNSIKDLSLTLKQGGEEVKEAFAHLKEEAYQENHNRTDNSRYVEETTDTVNHLLRDNTHIAADLNKLIKEFVIDKQNT